MIGLDSSSYLSDCVRAAVIGSLQWHPCLNMIFSESTAGHVFLLGTLLATSQHVLVLSITKVPKDFSHVAVVLVVNNPMQRDEHTKGQYTNAMHMHVHALHTHTQCTHDIHMHVCVDCI